MFELIFGIIWTLFVGIFVFGFFVAGGVHEVVPTVIIFVFFIVGIVLIIKGLKKVIKDYKTKNYGELCYGYIKSVYPSGAYVNGNPEYKADLDVYVPSECSCKELTETIGFNYNKYPINTFFSGKYYDGDVNLETSLSRIEDIPAEAQQYLRDKVIQPTNGDIIYVDGHAYKRID